MLNRSTEEIALNRYAAYPEPQTFPPRTQILAFINGVNCSGLCLICSHIVENPQYKIHKIWRDLNDGPCGERVGKREIIFFFIFLLDLPSSNDFSSEKPTRMFSQKLFCTKAVSLYLPDTKQSFTETRSSVSSALGLYNGNTIQLLLSPVLDHSDLGSHFSATKRDGGVIGLCGDFINRKCEHGFDRTPL